MKFVFDLDGTICFQGKPLSEKMVYTLDLLVKNGHEIIFASARPIRDLLPVLPLHMHHYPMIGGNGAFVVTADLNIKTVQFEPSIAEGIIRIIKTFEAEYLIDGAWDYAYNGSQKHPIRRNLDPNQRARNIRLEELNEIVKVVILRSLNTEQLVEELQKLPIITYLHGAENIIDISPQGVDKWTGLQSMGIQSLEFVAFGNDSNDVPMFQHAMRSIRVGDHPELILLTTEKVISEEEHVINKILEVMGELDKERSPIESI
ncbi:HAD-IIB family hydrolase [Paenibacillus luteus]|uniref:HAD-IIB family hydrolase n=1 Tax=Paenibacillus luteus TaxID=2545753 RepID=UPI001141994E|nr:HAD family hydrolase [Paenibacillus luteus]